MTLFVSAANGQSTPTNLPSSSPDALTCEQTFLALSFGTTAEPDPVRRAALLESTIYRAFRAVWYQYRTDPQRLSLCARVLAFCFLMERSRGEILQLWEGPESESDLLSLHPAVVDALASVTMEDNGMLSKSVFLEHLRTVAERYPDLKPKLPAIPLRPEPETEQAWPYGDSEAAGLIRQKDWTDTVCGEIATWPQSKKTSIELTLACQFPMIVLWGPQLIQFYNDGYRDLMGTKHPAGLGQPTRECWPEVWSINEPVYGRVLAGESITFQDQLFPIVRYGYLEDAYFTLCYSPLRNETASISGVLVTVFETTLRARSKLHRDRTANALGTNGVAHAGPRLTL